MRSPCKRPVCIVLFLTIMVSVCAAQQSPRSEVDAFARQLLSSSSQQRTELLAANPQLINVALRKELLRHGNNFLVDSKYTPALDPAGYREYIEKSEKAFRDQVKRESM